MEFFVIIVFVLGLIIGSFLNVVILRYNSGRSITGRSSCSSCGRELCWYDLIPLASFIAQRGRCRICGSRISCQYPIVELITGIVFAGVFVKVFTSYDFVSVFSAFIFFAVIWSLLVVISVYDIKHKIIPDGIVYAFDFLALVTIFVNGVTVPAIVAGPLLALPFALLWLISKGTWMGLGDAKLIIGIGWLLGLRGGFSAVVWGIWIGAVLSIAFMLIQRISLVKNIHLFSKTERFTMKSELPLGPFLIIGLVLVFFFNADVISFIQSIAG